MAQPDPEMSKISDLSLPVSLPAEDTLLKTGPGGGGGVNTLTGTVCNIVETHPIEGETIMESRTPTTIYETDEDEFMESEDTIPAVEASTTALRQCLEPEKTKKTAKRSLSAPRVFQGGYNLSYFNLWWSRMAVEGRREAKELRRLEEEAKRAKMRKMFIDIQGMNGKDVKHKDDEIPGSSREFVSSSVSDTKRVGISIEGGKPAQGVSGGRGVPNNATYERPQRLQAENFMKYGTLEKDNNLKVDILAPVVSVPELGGTEGKVKVRVAGR